MHGLGERARSRVADWAREGTSHLKRNITWRRSSSRWHWRCRPAAATTREGHLDGSRPARARPSRPSSPRAQPTRARAGCRRQGRPGTGERRLERVGCRAAAATRARFELKKATVPSEAPRRRPPSSASPGKPKTPEEQIAALSPAERRKPPQGPLRTGERRLLRLRPRAAGQGVQPDRAPGPRTIAQQYARAVRGGHSDPDPALPAGLPGGLQEVRPQPPEELTTP